MEGKKDPLL